MLISGKNTNITQLTAVRTLAVTDPRRYETFIDILLDMHNAEFFGVSRPELNSLFFLTVN